jgi:hypothetical protein
MAKFIYFRRNFLGCGEIRYFRQFFYTVFYVKLPHIDKLLISLAKFHQFREEFHEIRNKNRQWKIS